MSAKKKETPANTNTEPKKTFKPNPIEVEKLSTMINGMQEALLKEEEENVNVISESDFVSGFLPYFAGELNIKDNKDFIATWIGIAGNPSNEVAVVDGSNQEIFRVPALLNTKPIEPRMDGRFFDTMEEYAARGNQLAALGDHYLENQSNNLTKPIKEKIATNISEEERWASIFQRYGKKLPQSVKDNKEIILEDDDILDFD